MSIECRYCNPFTASASFKGISGFGDCGKSRVRTYEAKAVGFGVLRREVHDVSVDHPFSDDAQREQLRGDT